TQPGGCGLPQLRQRRAGRHTCPCSSFPSPCCAHEIWFVPAGRSAQRLDPAMTGEHASSAAGPGCQKTKTQLSPAKFQSFEEKSDPREVAPRLAALRTAMQEAHVEAFLIPRSDAHRGESVPASEARLAYITGFTGSAGTAVVGRDKAALFIDSRYTLQAPA